MQNFISLEDYDASIHREILDSLLRQGTSDYDPQIIEICEDRAISEISQTGTERHPLILMFALDIAIYHIFCQHNPYKISKIREDRYERATTWLKGVMKGDITVEGAPLLPSDAISDNSNWQIKSEEVRPVFD